MILECRKPEPAAKFRPWQKAVTAMYSKSILMAALAGLMLCMAPSASASSRDLRVDDVTEAAAVTSRTFGMERRSWIDAWLSVLLALAAPKQKCSLFFTTDFRYAASYIHRCAARPCAGSERFQAMDLTDVCSMEYLMPYMPVCSTSIRQGHMGLSQGLCPGEEPNARLQ